MANRYSIATGLASAVGTWDGGASVPVEGDRVLICTGHTVTLDGTYTWGDDSASTITINGVSTTNSITVVGTLKHSRSVSSSLTAKGSVQINSGGVYDQGTNADPITSSYTADLLLNKSASLAASKYGFRCINGGAVKHYGMFRKRVTTLASAASAGATSITVALATGWRIGDEIFLPGTSATDDQYEFATIAGSYTPGSTTVPLTAALSYAHANACPVGNMSSNVSVKPFDNTYPTGYNITFGTSTGAGVMEIGNALFRMGGSFSSGWGSGFVINADSNFTSTPFNNPFAYIESNAFLSKTSSAGVHCHSISQATRYPFNDCAYISTGGNGLNENGFTQHTRGLIFGTALQSGDQNYNFSDGGSFVDGWVAARNSSFANVVGVCKSAQFRGTKFLGPAYANCYNAVAGGGGVFDFAECDIAETFTRIGEPAVKAIVFGTAMKVTMTNCYTGSLTSMVGQKNLGASSFFKHINKDRDVTKQEEYYRDGTILRDNSEKKRSTSSMKMLPSTAATPFTRAFTLAVSAGETVRLVGYCKYDSTYYNGGTGFVAPTMTIRGTINGVTLTPVTYTATSANAGNWELIDKSITNTSGADGELTVTFSIQSAVTTGYVYWDGIVVPPMVVRARHYGYLFDEANPKRVVNPTVSASEATAAAYTGMTVTWGSSSSTISITADNTFQKLYDYTQAQGCLNIASAMPLTGAGVAGNPVLFAQGNITITTGDKLNGPGALSMGSYTLTTEFAGASAYTFTGGSWSQSTTIPTFSGGTVNIGGTGTYEFNTAGTVIVSMTPAGAGTYAMEAVTATGVLDLRNTTAHAITVELSTATAALAITSNNSGGTITISAPQIYQSVTLSGGVAGSRVQIYDTTSNTELYNGIPGAWPYTWTDPSPAAASRAIRVRVTKMSGATAKEMVEASIGTCAVTEPGNAISYVVTQVDDATYNLNAIDGSAVSNISIDDSTNLVKFNLAATGTVSNKSIYAYQVYWLNTETGIRDDFAFITSPDPANYLYENFQWKNIGVGTLTIVDGYPRDATTGLSATLIDTSGGNICVAPDHAIIVTTGDGPLTSEQATQLMNLPDASAVATAVWSKTLPL